MISMITGTIFTLVLFQELSSVECFVTRENAPRFLHSFSNSDLVSTLPSIPTALFAEQSGKKKRRRKRKRGPKAPVETKHLEPEKKTVDTSIDAEVGKIEDKVGDDAVKVPDDANQNKKEVGEEAQSSADASEKKFVFNRDEAIALGITDADEDEEIIPEFAPDSQTPSAPLPKLQESQEKPGGGAIDLPDIKDAVKRKKSAKDSKVEEEKEEDAVQEKISRKDMKSVVKLLEVEPQADSDLSFFQEEEYGTVSILLGEGTKPFLGIPSGPLQVGHFIGAIVIFLMAFIEYPGFPLTNLPTPLRDALQGGLGTTYAINIVLAVLSTFKAEERDQPKLLWAIKTFTVGGLAYDQLTQLPTAKQLKEAKSKKGKRAWKKNKK